MLVSREVAGLVVTAALGGLVAGHVFVLLLELARAESSVAPAYSVLLASLGIGACLGTIAAHTLRRLRLSNSAAHMLQFLSAFALIAVVYVGTGIFRYALIVVVGAGLAITTIALPALQGRLAAHELVRMAFHRWHWVATLGAVLGVLVSLVFLQYLGVKPRLIGTGLVAFALSWGSVRRSRRMKAEWSIDPRELATRMELLREVGIFEGAPRELLEAMASALEEQEITDGQDVIRQSRIPAYFFVVRAGSFEVLFSATREGSPARIRTLGPGSYFGEIGLLEGMPSTATVRATTDCLVYRIRGADFLRVVNMSSSLSQALQEKVAGGLALTDPSYRPAIDRGVEGHLDRSSALLLRELGKLAADLGPSLQPVGHEELLRSITSTAVSIFDAAACSLALLDTTEQQLVFQAASGRGAKEVEGMRVSADQGIAGWVLTSGDPLIVDDVQRDPRFAAGFAQQTGYKPRSVMAMPLSTDRLKLGVIEVLDPSTSQSTDAGVRLLSLFAGQAALAIEMSRVFSDLGRALFRAGSVAADGTDLGRALQQVAREAPAASGSLPDLSAAFLRLSRVSPQERREALRLLDEYLSGVRLS